MAASTGPADIVSTSLDQINSQLQAYLQQESILMGTVWRQFPVSGAKQIALPDMDGFTVSDKTSKVDTVEQSVTTGADILLLDKEKYVAFSIEDKAQEQSVVDLSGAALQRAARDMAYQMDLDIYAGLKLVAAGNGLAFDNASSLGKTDILNAKVLLEEEKLRFSDCIIAVNPQHHRELLEINEFISADYQSGAPVMTGEVGRLYGARVIMTNAVDDSNVTVYHPEHCAFAVQREMRIETDRNIRSLADEYAVHASYGVKGGLMAGIKGVVLGTVI